MLQLKHLFPTISENNTANFYKSILIQVWGDSSEIAEINIYTMGNGHLCLKVTVILSLLI